jgi:hypothetical protein
VAERTSIWTVINAVLGAIAAIVTAGTGLYLALRSDPASSSPGKDVPVVESVEPLDGIAYDRTPWLGVALWQNDKPVRLRSVNDSWEQFEAKLAPGPFELTLARRADDPSIGILAWHDDSIFRCVRDGTLYLPGTGIAGAVFAVPILYLNKEGFNYYDTERMKRLADDKYAIYISTIGSGELELPLARFTGPIYLIIFRDPKDFAMEVPGHDFELFTLRR